MLRSVLAREYFRNRNSRSPVMQKHLRQTLLFTLVETYDAWCVGWVAPLDAATAESRGGCLGAIEVAPVTARPLKKGRRTRLRSLYGKTPRKSCTRTPIKSRDF